MLNTITNIDKASPARGKVQVGDELLSINGHGVEDVLDYRYWSYEPRLSLTLRSGATGGEYEVKIRKGEGEDLGLDFEEYLMDRPWGCSNRCLFCFIDQLPRACAARSILRTTMQGSVFLRAAISRSRTSLSGRWSASARLR